MQCRYCKKKTDPDEMNAFEECPKCAGKTMFKIMGKKSVFSDRPKKKRGIFRPGPKKKGANVEAIAEEVDE